MNNDKRALVYQHIFADGSKYFGNAVNPNRPWDFINRNDKWLAAFTKYGAPVVQVRYVPTIVEADNLELWLFDRYIAKGGAKLQARPSGKDLEKTTLINKGRNISDDHRANLSKSKKGKKQPKISAAKVGKKNPKLSVRLLGKKLSEKHRANISIGGKGISRNKGKTTRSHRKVISTLDGRITSANTAGRLDNLNPAYIGTWTDYIEE